MTGTTVTDAATPSTSATYNDQNFADTYTAEATDDAIAVTSNELPVITGEAQTVVQPNTTFDPMLTMAATDKEDGDLTTRIVVVSNPVDTSKSGAYDVTYEVTDSDGNKGTFTRHVIVEEAPVITGEATTKLNPNSGFDPMSTMQATDKEDGNLTDKLVIVSNNVDTSQPGNYEIVYEVTDSDGNTSTFQRAVTVTEIPVITIEDNVQVNRGTAFNPLAYVKANDKEDGDLTSQVKVISNTVDINKAGTYQVTYEVTDSDGNKATKTMQVKVATVGTIKTNPFTITKDGYVTGTYAGDVARIAMVVDGQVYGKIPVPVDGTYKYYAGSKISSLSNHVEMVAYDTAGKELDRSDVTIQEVPPTVGDITAAEYTIGSSYITGSYTGDVARINVSINGDELEQIPASGNQYRYYVGSRVTSLDDKVEVIAYDAKGKELNRTNVSLKQDLPVGSIISNDYLVGGADKYIRGTATGDITHVKLEVNGTIMSSPAFIQENSSFQYYVGSHIASIDDNVVLVGYDAEGVEVSRTKVNLKETQGTIATQDYLVGGADKYIRGTTTGDITHVKLEVNGTVMTSPALIQEDNSFQYYTGSHIASTDDNVVLIGYNAQGKEISRKTVNLIATQGTIAVEDYVVGGADKYIHGTSTGDVYRLKLIVNGETLSSKTYVQPGNVFNYYVASDEIISAENDKVEMVAYDNMGNELDRSIVNLQ
ncbi:immunoglobulin-like domain-containing protein [Listeria riparia]|uniref:Putative peptidoglycan linked protein n=1 Tax=Listeria riparia FSL S10-1204 TaxID=1265816 RepID=W7CZX2_9LIST|nr:immunoglobulin-like domain-containing protein [Listeria riparia]EUJ42492.1 putative peptidoglycan linked protein [Listeria riparia FSL S10-1204]